MGISFVVLVASITIRVMAKFVLSLLTLACLAALSQAVKVHPQPRDCSFEIAAMCVSEIGAAWDSCQDFSDADSILGCMEGIIGATDCWDCVCVVLFPPILCLVI